MKHSGSEGAPKALSPSLATGTENLELMSVAGRYLAHIGAVVAKSLPANGPIVEFGSGSGAQTEYVGIAKDRLTCVEIDETQRASLSSRGFRVARDLNELSDAKCAGAFSINCLEHLEDDLGALKGLWRTLQSGAPLAVFVPAFPMLYSSMDARVGHVRRYGSRELVSKLQSAGFVVEKVEYVDSVGFVLSSLYKALKRQSGAPSVASLKLFDNVLFPVSVQLDKVLRRWFGKNLLVVGRKP